MDEGALRRRDFLQRAAYTAGLAGAATVLPADLILRQAAVAEARRAKLPKPRNVEIDHFVIVMMENRSFDHYFGWLSDLADGIQQQTFRDAATGQDVQTQHASKLEAGWQGCGHPDPGHGWDSGRAQLKDGFLAEDSGNDIFALSYYNEGELQFIHDGGQAVHALRPLLLLGADLHLAEPLLQVVRAGRRAQDQRPARRDRRQPVGHDLRPGDRPEPDRHLLQLGPAVLRGVGGARRVVDAAARGLLPGVRVGDALEHLDRRPAVPRRRGRRRDLRRRAPARRRPAGPGLDGRRGAGVREVAQLPPRRAVHRLRRVGRLLRPRAPAARARHPRVARHRGGLGSDGLPDPGGRGLPLHAPVAAARASGCRTRRSDSSRSSS